MSGSKQLYSQKDIADKLGIDKNKIYRYINNHHIKEYSKERSKLLYTEQQTNRIIKAFSNESETERVAHENSLLLDQIDTLKNELKQKNAEINQLQKLLDQQQQLNLSNQRLLEQQNTQIDVDTPPTQENGTQTPHEAHKAKGSLWRRLFK